MITLPTGRQIALYNVAFDADAQRFYYGSLDVTPYMTRAQMVEVGGMGFDVEAANRAASDAARDAAGLPRVPDTGNGQSFLDTPVLQTLLGTAQGVGEDISGIATGIRNFAGIGPENAGKRSPLFWVLVIGGLGFIAYQIGLFAWVKNKLTSKP